MFCPNCGNMLSEEDVFCTRCGARSTKSAESYMPNNPTDDDNLIKARYKDYCCSCHKGAYRFLWALFLLEIGLMIFCLVTYKSYLFHQYGELPREYFIDELLLPILLLAVSFVAGIIAMQSNKGLLRIACLAFPAAVIWFFIELYDVDFLDYPGLCIVFVPIVIWFIIRNRLRCEYLDYLNPSLIEEKKKSADGKATFPGRFIIGTIILAIGVICTVWANNYEPSFEEKVDKLVDGKKIENEERAETMRVLGPIIIVVGAAITVFAIVQYKGGIVLIRHPEKDTVAKLKEYKELLDSGIISQEEFDRKKAELLNL